MLVLELFDKPATTTKKDEGWSDPKRVQYNFTTPNGQEVEIIFLPLRGSNETEVMFAVGDGRDSMKITNAGEELLIFSTVLSEIKKYKAANPEQAIMFTAAVSEPSRIKLYDRMMKKIPGTTRIENEFEVEYTIQPQTGQQ